MITIRIDADKLSKYYDDIKWLTLIKGKVKVSDLETLNSFWGAFIKIMNGFDESGKPSDWFWDENPVATAHYVGADTVEIIFKRPKWYWGNANANNKDEG